VQDFEETPEAVTKEAVQLMNKLDLNVSIEDVDELTAFHSEPMSNEDLTEQEVNKTPSEAEDDDNQSPSTKTLTTKKMNEAFSHLEQFFSIMENIILTQREALKVVQLLKGTQLATHSFIKRRRWLVFNFLSTNF
jgi:hypothetical protein